MSLKIIQWSVSAIKLFLKNSLIVDCPVESEEANSVQKGFTMTFAAINPQLKFLEPSSDFQQGKESCSCDFSRMWMLPAAGLKLALCLLTLKKKSPASLQELKYGGWWAC